MKKIKGIRLALDDTWDIIYRVEHGFSKSLPYMKVVRTIIYTPKDDCKSKIRIL